MKLTYKAMHLIQHLYAWVLQLSPIRHLMALNLLGKVGVAMVQILSCSISYHSAYIHMRILHNIIQ